MRTRIEQEEIAAHRLATYSGENTAATVAQHAEFPGAARAFMAQPRGVGVTFYSYHHYTRPTKVHSSAAVARK